MAGELLGTIGTLAGAGLGMVAGGPAGAALGAKLGSAAGGLAQGVAGAITGKKANSMLPSEIDPSQTRLLEEARRKARQAEIGTDAATQANVREAEQLGEATKSDISKITGGNVGGTIDALLKAQRITGKNINSAMATGSQRALAYDSMASRMADAIAQRKIDLQMIKAAQAKAKSAQNVQTGSQNAQAGILSSLPIGGGSGGMSLGGSSQGAASASPSASPSALGGMSLGGTSAGSASPSVLATISETGI